MNETKYAEIHMWVPRLCKELESLRQRGFAASMVEQPIVTLDGESLNAAVGIECGGWSIRANFGERQWVATYWELRDDGMLALMTRRVYLSADNLSALVLSLLVATNDLPEVRK